MIITLLAAALALPATPSAPELRTVTVVVTDETGAPVDGLGARDVVVLENGVARDVGRFERDQRPLTLALLVDTSEAMGTSLRLHLIDAVNGFLDALPPGTRYALWRTGDRPEKIVDYSDDRAAAAKALRRTFPQGGNTVLDALVEASRDLKKLEGARTAVVALTGLGLEFSNRTRYGVVDEARGNADVFSAVSIDEGGADFEARGNYEYVLSMLASASGGLHERTLSSMGAAAMLRKLAGDLRGRYRLSYATEGGLTERKLDVQVARPGAKARVAEGRADKR